ncbi:MerR family transcriptional regulator [Novosphingobium pentaromativorans]|uniref:Transcriptional regulator n=1 Tax=Novosphingobium pentaromativorans US6-1 TaxID=1088721 RepID=G6EII8_9SPHN|nr:MerR family transcriptional regulator [Novosphingobium pentaromativorans]AIT78810.1 transcriptional regulator [Novosphingobium pentaromativorans US6-1]EHJ58930.1 transcriptional regulator [Novosphingobium pentaromativorans US6-1]
MTILSDIPVFDDGKDPEALRTIGEVSKALGIRQHVLRYWEEQFPSLQPVKRSGGRRYYRRDDVALVVEINRLVHQEGYTLRGARKAIEDQDARPTPAAVSGPEAQPQTSAVAGGDIIGELRQIRAQLAAALAAA